MDVSDGSDILDALPPLLLTTYPSGPLLGNLSESDRRVFDRFFPMLPLRIFPLDDILRYIPARSNAFCQYVIYDPAAIHCLLMCGSMYEAASLGEEDLQGFAPNMSKVCSMVNCKLDQQSLEADPISMECAATLALMAVSRRDGHSFC